MKRPWIAALLAFVYPGLGHVYLQAWLRALVWFLLVVTTVTIVVPEAAIEEMEYTVESMTAVAEAIPIDAFLALLTVTILNIVDAYWLASRQRRKAAPDAETPCPACGKPLDEDLDFCHWCTTEFEARAAEER